MQQHTSAALLWQPPEEGLMLLNLQHRKPWMLTSCTELSFSRFYFSLNSWQLNREDKKKKTFMSTLRAKGWVSLFRKSAFSLYFLCFFSTSWSLQEASKTAFHWTCLTKKFVFFFLWGKRKVNLLKNEWTVFGKRMQNYFTESLNTFKVYHYLNYLGT